jgi:hypothetical protein
MSTLSIDNVGNPVYTRAQIVRCGVTP